MASTREMEGAWARETPSPRLALVFSSVGHTYIHLFTAFYATIVLALEDVWAIPYADLLELWWWGSLLVGLGALPAGWIADRWSAPGMMAVYFVGLGASGIVCGLSDAPVALMLGLTSLGLFASIYHPVGIAWLVRQARPHARGKALGINGVFGGIGVAAAALVAGVLTDTFGWRAAFLVPGAVCLATGLVFVFLWQRGWIGDRCSEQKDQQVSGADRLRGFLVLLFTMFVIGLTFQATQVALPKLFDLRLGEMLGGGLTGVGLVVFLVYTVGSLVQLLGGHLADRLPLKRVYLAMLALQVPTLVLIATLTGLPLIPAAMMTVLLSTAALPAENMMLARFTPARHHSLAFGLKFVISFGVAPISLALVAYLEARTGEFLWLYLVLAGFGLAAALIAWALPGDRPQRTVVVEPEVAPAE